MVSWTTYLLAVSIFLVTYYMLVVLVCFRREIFRKLKAAPAKQVSALSPLQAIQPVETAISRAVANGFEPVPLLDEIHAFMNQAAEQLPVGEDELVSGVKRLLEKYPAIEDSFFRLSINDLVVSLAESKCDVQISREELSRLWS